MKNQRSNEMFKEYRALLETEVNAYNSLKTLCPDAPLPTIAARIWRLSILAEAWGILATRLSGGKVDYLSDWRHGK